MSNRISNVNYLLLSDIDEFSRTTLNETIKTFESVINFCFWVKDGKIQEIIPINMGYTSPIQEVLAVYNKIRSSTYFNDGLVVMSYQQLTIALASKILDKCKCYIASVKTGEVTVDTLSQPLTYIHCTSIPKF